MVRQLSALLVGEVSPGEAFQRRAELICLGHPAAETLAHGDPQVPGQQLRLGGQAHTRRVSLRSAQAHTVKTVRSVPDTRATH